MNIILAIMIMGCSTHKVDSQDNQEVPGALSECGQLVMEEGEPTAFDECFEAEGSIAYSCETCGYYMDVSMSQGAFDCITCHEGYEIDVVFDDCTGYCVPVGTAVEPVYMSQCNPVTDCVREQ